MALQSPILGHAEKDSLINMKAKVKTPAFIRLKSSLQAVELYDVLNFEKIKESKIHIIKACPERPPQTEFGGSRGEKGFKIATNDSNPIFKAALALQKRSKNRCGAKIIVQKNVPTYSGLNSQSSNAAGALIALNKLWNLNLKMEELIQIAHEIDPTIGTILKMQSKRRNLKKENAILIRPKYIVIETKWITKKARPSKGSGGVQKTAFEHFPDLKAIHQNLNQMGAEKSGLSGKGSMLFGLFKKPVNPDQMNETFGQKSDFIWVGKTCKGLIKLLE